VKLPFRRRKRFLVRLTAKGKQLPLGTVEARDYRELMAKLADLLQQSEDYRNYPVVRIMDLETGNEVKVNNPFAEIEESTPERSTRSRESFLEMLADEAVRQNIVGAFTFLSQLMAESMKTVGSVMVDVLRSAATEAAHLRTPPPPEQGPKLKDVIDAGRLILDLYLAYREDPEGFERFLRDKISAFFGGGGGEARRAKRAGGEAEGAT